MDSTFGRLSVTSPDRLPGGRLRLRPLLAHRAEREGWVADLDGLRISRAAAQNWPSSTRGVAGAVQKLLDGGVVRGLGHRSRAVTRACLIMGVFRSGRTSLGSDADPVVLDPATTPMLSRRTARAQSLPELPFAPAVLGDDRAIEATYVAGQRFYHRAMPGR